MSAHPASPRAGLFAALVAQVSEYLLEPVEQTIEPEPLELEPYPVIAVVSAGRKSGASTIARLLAAELAVRAGGAALVAGSGERRQTAPPSRAAARLATALGAAGGSPRGCGRLCVASPEPFDELVTAGRYLAPIVLDVPPDGSAAASARLADRAVVVAAASDEPALLAAIGAVLGSDVVKCVNRAGGDGWSGRADVVIPDARMGARAAALGLRALGLLGAAIGDLADALGCEE